MLCLSRTMRQLTVRLPRVFLVPHCPGCARHAPTSHSVLLPQAVRAGSAAVSAQCCAIDAWAARVGARKRPVALADADAMATLQERIAGMAAGEIEAAYRTIQGARPASRQFAGAAVSCALSATCRFALLGPLMLVVTQKLVRLLTGTLSCASATSLPA